MPFPRTRREILQRGVPIVAIPVTGCASLNPTECDEMQEAVIRAEQVDFSSVQKTTSDPLVYENMSSEQQDPLRTAINEGTYRKCPAADPYIPEPLSSFARRASNHADGNNTAYLKRNDVYYKLYVKIEDEVYVD